MNYIIFSINSTLRGRFELPLPRWRTSSQEILYKEKIEISKQQLYTYLETREISGLSNSWMKDMKRCLKRYLDYIKWNINQESSLKYFKNLKDTYSHTNYKRNLYQIRKFLMYLNIDWANNIQPTEDLEYIPKRITVKDIDDAISHHKEDNIYLNIKALIHLGACSGLRSNELYQLRIEDVDIPNRIINVNHNPDEGQTTKTKRSRISFFTEETGIELNNYLKSTTDSNGKCIFNKRQIQDRFQNTRLKVKDLRKYFSQEWDRRGGPTSIKKILMGHSLKGDVDLMHYNAQSPEDLKKIFDRVMGQGLDKCK